MPFALLQAFKRAETSTYRHYSLGMWTFQAMLTLPKLGNTDGKELHHKDRRVLQYLFILLVIFIMKLINSVLC